MFGRVRIALYAFMLLVGVVAASATALAQDGVGHVSVLTVDGVINPPAASYIDRGIEEAEEQGANIVVLELDTPGGLDSSTREIVQSIDNAGVPVVLYVTPQGGRAASAGTFIAMASHIAVMAPGTTIGSATPVALGGEGQAQGLPEDLRNKIVNEAASYIRAHAEVRGRNADWAERAVREGANLPANEAVEMNVVEHLARDLDELLQIIDGTEVQLGSGAMVTVETADAPVRREGMGFFENFLHTIANPDVALILMSISVLGIIVEVTNPGLIFPGVAGAVMLLLGFYGLGTLNANWVGVGLLLLGIGLVVAEAFTPTLGVLGFSGVAIIVLGSFLMFGGAPPGARPSNWTIAGVGVIAGGIALLYVRAIWRSQRYATEPMGIRTLVGETGTVRSKLEPEGTVFVHGERWHAILTDEGEADVGEKVVVDRAEGSRIWVRKTGG